MEPVVVLRLITTEEHHDEVMSLLPASRVDNEWRRGQRRNARVAHQNSGANVLLVEEGTPNEALSKSLKIVSRKLDLFRKVRDLGTEMELDLGFDAVIPEDRFSLSLFLKPDEAGTLKELGIVLRLTMYRADTPDSEETD